MTNERVKHTCCQCGALIASRCLSCDHEQCASCPPYVPEPTYEELKSRLSRAEAQLAESRKECERLAKEYEQNLVIPDCKQCHGHVWVVDSESGGFEVKCHCYQVLVSELKAELRTLREENARLKGPVTDEEWASFDFPVEGYSKTVIARQDFDVIIAARTQPQAGGEKQ